jgi:Domain of unknown function (DUF4091)
MKNAIGGLISVIVFGCGVACAQMPDVWVVPSTLLRVGQADAAGSGTSATLYGGRGEYVSFQVAVHAPAGGLKKVNFSVSSLTGPGGAVIRNTSANLILYRERYITVKRHSPITDEDSDLPFTTDNGVANVPVTDIDTFPDPLIPFIDPATGKAPPTDSTYVAAPVKVDADRNVVFWVDVFVPRGTPAGRYRGIYTVTSNLKPVTGKIKLTVWNFTLPLQPSLKSLFNGGIGAQVAGVERELLRNRLTPDSQTLSNEARDIHQYGLNVYDFGYYENVSYGNCTGDSLKPAPPSLETLQNAVDAQPGGLYLVDYTADPESSCTNTAYYKSVIAFAQVLHKAVVPGQDGVDNVVSQQPVAELFDDGLGTGRSAVDVWTMLPLNFDLAQQDKTDGLPNVTYVQQKGDKVWSYNAEVQDGYSPKWELDFLPINYRIQTGFLSQSLGLSGINYWAVTNWASASSAWTNPQGGSGLNVYPGEGILVYPGAPAGLKGVAPSMRLKYIRDGVQDYEYVQLLKSSACNHEVFAEQSMVALSASGRGEPNWHDWTMNAESLEHVRIALGNKLSSLGCVP